MSHVAIRRAIQLHQAGNFEDAHAAYSAILAKQPTHADVCHLLGILLYDMGQIDEAKQLVEKAIQLKPKQSVYYSNLALILDAEGDRELAEQQLKHAITLDKKNSDAYVHLSDMARDSGQYDEAMQWLLLALQYTPMHQRVQFNLALLCSHQGKIAQAINYYDKLLSHYPNHYESLVNQACLMWRLRQFRQAQQTFERAIAVDNHQIDAPCNLANLLIEQKDYRAADRIMTACTQQATTLPARVWLILCIVKAKCGNYADSLSAITKAAQLAPDDIETQAIYYANLLGCCFWDKAAVVATQVRQCAERATSSSDGANLVHYVSLLLARTNAEQYYFTRLLTHYQKSQLLPGKPFYTTGNRKLIQTPIRLAYLSADFSAHVVGFLINHLFAFHNREQFYIIAIDDQCFQDDTYQCIMQSVDDVLSIGEYNDRDAARLIYDAQIDVLIDLGGYSGNSRLQILHYRPAPIQCHMLGDAGTLANPAIDYLISTVWQIPPSERQWYQESIVYLPARQPFATQAFTQTTTMTRQAYGLPDAFVFACFKSPIRFTQDVFDAWMCILQQVPHSVLWLQMDNPIAQAQCRQFAQCKGIATDRLIITPEEPMTRRCGYQLADCLLECFSVAGDTAALLCLTHGIPVVAHYGVTQQSRYCAGLLQALDLHACVAHTPKHYIDIACQIATDTAYRNNLRIQIKQQIDKSALFDQPGFAYQLERAVKQMCQDYTDGQKKRDIILDE